MSDILHFPSKPPRAPHSVVSSSGWDARALLNASLNCEMFKLGATMERLVEYFQLVYVMLERIADALNDQTIREELRDELLPV